MIDCKEIKLRGSSCPVYFRNFPDVDYYGAMDADETIDTIMTKLILHPIEVIDYLLSVIDEYQEQ